jgi:microcystin degradation protein MlrC
MRIGIAGISHEALTFSPIPQTMEDFRVLTGHDVLGYTGLADAVKKHEFEPVPLLVASARCPSGVVEERTYLELRGEMLKRLKDAGPLDGICLILHGAMLVENIWSGETDQVRMVRAAVGRDVPIAVRLDPHANLTEEFANKADTWAAFRTAPHVDAPETLRRTLGLLTKVARNNLRPRPVFIRIPLLLPGERSTMKVEPMKSMLAMALEIEKMPGILNAEVLIGFGWADTWHAGANVLVTAESERSLPEARRQARRMAQAMWDARKRFVFDQEVAQTADEAIDEALKSDRTVFIADSGDNPTAGAPGDSTHFLARLVAKKVPDAVVAGFPDAVATDAAFAAGVGDKVTVHVGGKLDAVRGGPVELTGTVEQLHKPANAWEAKLAVVNANGIRVLISDRRYIYRHPDDFKKLGIDPLKHKMVVIKLGYLMAPIREIAPREILALTPGYADMDFTRLPYKQVTRPIYPLDTEFDWHPIITNVAGYDEKAS